MHPFIWGIIVVVLTIAVNEYLLMHGQILAAQHRLGPKTVVDVSHTYLPNLDRLHSLYNSILILFFMVIPIALAWNDFDKSEFVKAALPLFAAVIICRQICTIQTMNVPTTFKQREHGHKWKQYVFGHDYDLGCSGHVAVAIAMVLLMMEFGIIRNRVLWGGGLVAFGLFSATTRMHYSLDIIVAFFVVPVCYDFLRKESATRRLMFDSGPYGM